MQSRKLIVLGAGGHARVILATLAALDLAAAGTIARSPPAEPWPENVPYLGDDSQLADFSRNEVQLIGGIGSTGSTALRREIFDRARALGFEFATLVHPAAYVAPGVEIGDGTLICAGAIVQTGCHIGQNVIVNTRAVVDHDGRIGDHSHVATGAVLSGTVTLGNGVHIGTGAAVIQGIRIGDRAIVAAGAAVVSDVPTGISVGGVPARQIGGNH